MKLVYVAGPYRGENSWEVEKNIHRARSLGAYVAKETGAMPVIPHANTAHFDGLKPDEFWIEGTLELMRRCDAIIIGAGWSDSEGTKAEIKEAMAIGVPVAWSLADLLEILEKKDG